MPFWSPVGDGDVRFGSPQCDESRHTQTHTLTQKCLWSHLLWIIPPVVEHSLMLPPYLKIPPQLATVVPIERCSVGSINVCEVAPQSARDMKRMDNRITEANRLLLPHGVMRCIKHEDNRGRLRSFSVQYEDCKGS